jgi:hypothetical protein
MADEFKINGNIVVYEWKAAIVISQRKYLFGCFESFSTTSSQCFEGLFTSTENSYATKPH